MTSQKRVIAIHDISCLGRCSLTVALPILSAAGIDTGVLPTAVLSTHTGGFTGFTFRDLTGDIAPISEHWQTLGLEFDALYSGFLGSFEQIDLIAEIFDKFKSDKTIIYVDPVMGDNGILYTTYTNDMAQGVAKLCAKADIIAPNLTEAAFLLNEPYVADNYDKKYIEELLKRLAFGNVSKVVLTGISFEKDQLGAACYNKTTGEISYAFNKRIDGHFHGTGDVFSSAVLAALLNGFCLTESAQIAVDYTYKCIEYTVNLQQDRKYGVCFEKALPELIKLLKLGE